MGLDLSQFKALTVAPCLAAMGAKFASPAALNLMTGIANKESGGLVYISQLDGGPARGPFQVEKITHDDQYNTFLDYPANAELKAIITTMIMPGFDPYGQMIYNHFYNCAVARVKVWRAPPPLPAANDAAGMAAYHKLWYNTAGGATVVDAADILCFQEAIDA
jgi:hypothetical protein